MRRGQFFPQIERVGAPDQAFRQGDVVMVAPAIRDELVGQGQRMRQVTDAALGGAVVVQEVRPQRSGSRGHFPFHRAQPARRFVRHEAGHGADLAQPAGLRVVAMGHERA